VSREFNKKRTHPHSVALDTFKILISFDWRVDPRSKQTVYTKKPRPSGQGL